MMSLAHHLNSRLRRLRVAHLWPLAVVIGIFVFLNTHPIRPHDFWWHMAAGREVVTTRLVPTVDTHSFTATGTPYPAYQVYWFAEAIFYLIYTLGGPALIVFTHSLIVTTAYALTLWLAYRLTRNWRIAAIATLFAAALGMSDWNVRPQAFTFWLAPLFLLAVDAYRRQPRRGLLVVFPLGMALWVNCHGSFPLGLLLIGLWLADEVWRLATKPEGRSESPSAGRLTAPTIALATGLLGCLLNPAGLGILTYVRDLTSDPAVQQLVPEWAPPTFDTLHGGLFLVALLTTAALLAISPRRPTFYELASFLAFGALGLRTTRGAIWFGLVMAPTLADHSAAFVAGLRSPRRNPPGPEPAMVNRAFAALLCLSAVVTLPWFKRYLPLPPLKAGLISSETPTEATDYLLAHQLPGPIFNEVGFGSYLAWAAQPDYPVFVDPRIELYPYELWVDYIEISAARCDWEQELSRYGIHTLMLSPMTQNSLIHAARRSQEWSEIHTNPAASIFTRREHP